MKMKHNKDNVAIENIKRYLLENKELFHNFLTTLFSRSLYEENQNQVIIYFLYKIILFFFSGHYPDLF